MSDLLAGPDLADEHERLTQLLYQMPVGVLRCRVSGEIELMNPLVVQLLQHLMATWLSDSVYDLLAPCFPDFQSVVQAHGTKPGRMVDGQRLHVPPAAPGAEPGWLAMTAMRLSDDEMAIVLADVTREVAREQQMRQASAWISALIQGDTAHMSCRLNAQGRITVWSPAAERLCGATADRMLDRHASAIFADEGGPERFAARLARAERAGWDLDEGFLVGADGRRIFTSSIITVLHEGLPDERYALVVRDMTERREAAQALQRATVRDFLTGVHNRAFLYTVGEEEVARSALGGEPVSVILIDADFFKRVNDTHGHDAGDEALRRIAQACQRQLRAHDMLARLGGEEFCAVLFNCRPEAALRVAERMRAAVEAERIPLPSVGILRVTASFGVASDQGLKMSLRALTDAADGALYRAKAQGRNRVVTCS